MSMGLRSCPLSSRECGNPRPQVAFCGSLSLSLCLSAPQPSATSWGCVLPALWGSHRFLPSLGLSINCSLQVHGVALSEQDLQREIKAQLAQLPASASEPPPRPQARLPGAPVGCQIPAFLAGPGVGSLRAAPRKEREESLNRWHHLSSLWQCVHEQGSLPPDRLRCGQGV